MREHHAVLDFQNNLLQYDNVRVPFAKTEIVEVKPRSVTPAHVNVSNPENQTGYVSLLPTESGIYFGNALVTNSHGKAYLPVFNTTEQLYELEVPTVPLLDYDTFDSEDIRESDPSATVQGHAATPTPSSSVFTPSTQPLNALIADSEKSDSHMLPLVPLSSPYLGREESIQEVQHSSYFSNSSNTPLYTSDRADSILQLLRINHLNSEEKDELISLIHKNSDRFQLPSDPFECTNATQHSIPTINELPIHTKQYRFPPIHKDEINKQVDGLLKNNIVEYSSSPYNSPVWIVPKKPDSAGNKRWRMVIDYRLLNEKTIGDAYPLPNITDILDQLGNAKYFSVLDLASGFHQIPINPQDAPKTAFSTPYGHYQFRRMPFGLKNAPATFQRLMDNVLTGLQGNELFVYMDDIVIYARSLQEHAVKLNKLMTRLRNANLKLQPDKCEFLRKEVAYLGHIIGADGVRPDPGKIKSIQLFPQPRNQKNIKQFLGLVGYYRRFIPQFSKIAKPLSDLLKKDTPFNFQQKHIEAFDTLRNCLCTEPILQYPDFNQPFVLTTDASGYAIGGILSQGKIGKDLPIAYVSRVLNKAEQNYSVIEKECLAIVYCTNHFRPYLYGQKFTIVTDHKPLIWLYSIKDPSSRLWKWRAKLVEYNYEFYYKKGTSNTNADALSRNPPDAIALPMTAQPIITEPNDDSNESIFSANPIPVSVSPTPVPIPDPEIPPDPDPLFEIENSSQSGDSDSEIPSDSDEENDDNEQMMFQSDSIPAIQKINETKLNIAFSRDGLTTQKDNLVIFITSTGEPFDRGAKELQKNDMLPKYTDITFERAKVTSIGSKFLIALPVKLNKRILIETGNIKNCLESLVDVITEFDLPSFSINTTSYLDEIPWDYFQKQLSKYFREFPIKITICQNLITAPEIPERLPLITEYHASAIGGHKGITKTYNRLRTHYYWNSMKLDIQKYIQNCKECQLKKLTRVKTKQPMIITDTPGSAFDKIALDIMGPLPESDNGNNYILTLQDLLTKYSVAVPLKEATSLTIADAFTKHFICIYGAPKAILTDQGSNFLTSLMKNLAKKFKITHFKTTAYHPQSNGSIERSHHVLTEYLKTQINKDSNWDDYVSLAMFSYNTSVHEGTKYSPYQLVFGRVPRTPSSYTSAEDEPNVTYQQYLTDLFNRLRDTQEDARRNLIRSKERTKNYYDKRVHQKTFKQGDNVFLLKEPRKGKFGNQYSGPYKVLEVLTSNNIRILFRNKPRVVHADKLKLTSRDPTTLHENLSHDGSRTTEFLPTAMLSPTLHENLSQPVQPMLRDHIPAGSSSTSLHLPERDSSPHNPHITHSSIE
ncbi:PREDICTED: uncharacterized protein LOC105556922 [Vollenhovia emeryi]|uniref:uncharacterized protein LOC105556922 n=1 Tax=Vollenhovia emeryi TaxID=411798 RepID=UPI0005F42307|nr:PREDICTED: uncharacterized protein LOC105556922 [Vollenhovia emeryi]